MSCSKMEDEDIAPNMYIQLIQSVWAESRPSTLYFSMCTVTTFCLYSYRLGLLYKCIWRKILVFHFAGSSMYNSFIYGWNILIKYSRTASAGKFLIKLIKGRIVQGQAVQDVQPSAQRDEALSYSRLQELNYDSQPTPLFSQC